MSTPTAARARGPVDPRLVRHSGAVRRHLVVVVALGTVVAVLVVAQAWLVSDVVADGFAGGGTSDALLAAVTALALVLAGRAVLDWGHQVLAARAATAVTSALREEVAEALVAGRPGATPSSTGRVVALLGHGLDALEPYVGRYLPALGLAVTVPGVVVVALFAADTLAAVTVAVTLPLVIVFMVLVGWLTEQRTQRRWDALARLTHHFADVLAGLTVLTVLGRAASQVTGLRDVGERHRRATTKALRLAFLSSMVLELVATVSVALVAVGVGLRVVEGHLGLKTGLFVLLLAPEAFAPLRRLGTHFHDSAEGVAASREAFAVLDRAEGDSPGRRGAPDLDLAVIELRGVSVRHDNRDGAAPDRASLVLRPGESVALAGPSGCGKSTLLAVLLGTARPDAGSVEVGGVDLAELDLEDWRRQLAWVPQHPVLVDGTVADNVRLGGTADDADVRAALDDAGADDLALDRRVGEAGAELSSGERRRVGVARALLRVRHRGARLLLLDEPTAGLDAATESRVLDALHGAGATLVTAAHRRAALDRCDRVVDLGVPR
ncbi:thiol reductant ABC exporter subunit CydD [Solicola sp. PLA-1-18]|uniref:thiol reductant ABC exporter subunit CydD n=1 Tax=Solicola sp. PLA-1-18 TaxID=3380532 RepID=UPI003B7F3F25